MGAEEWGSRLSDLLRSLPRLKKSNHTITSPQDPNYNCIAWAASEDDRWWWPDPWQRPIYFWPRTAPREETLRAFELAYKTLGYRKCENGDLEDGFTKIAIFANGAGVPTHAARQLPNGKWTSKCGEDVDMEHELEAVGGGLYGEAVLFMKRKSA